MTAFLASYKLRGERKFDMVDVQNATLAGGVMVGTSANMMIYPCGAIAIGALAGLLSVYGYVVTPTMAGPRSPSMVSSITLFLDVRVIPDAIDGADMALCTSRPIIGADCGRWRDSGLLEPWLELV